MKLLIIGDVHTKFEKAERICQKFEKDYKIIFVGDYFDQFNDTPLLNFETAEWLQHSLHQPNRIHLRGNHDECYDPRVNTFCSGFSVSKKKKINEVLTIEDWDKLKYFHFENDWWFSHAGLTMEWFADPSFNLIEESYIEKIINDSIIKQQIGNYDNCIWASDYDRGGNYRIGGILWCDWSNLDNIPYIKQVVGHTPVMHINVIEHKTISSINVNVDCSSSGVYHSECLEIDENSHYSIINTSTI